MNAGQDNLVYRDLWGKIDTFRLLLVMNDNRKTIRGIKLIGLIEKLDILVIFIYFYFLSLKTIYKIVAHLWLEGAKVSSLKFVIKA